MPPKAKSGTRADFEHQAEQTRSGGEDHARTAIAKQTQRANEQDLHAKEYDASPAANRCRANPAMAEQSPGRSQGQQRRDPQEHRTDNESAKMATSKV